MSDRNLRASLILTANPTGVIQGGRQSEDAIRGIGRATTQAAGESRRGFDVIGQGATSVAERMNTAQSSALRLAAGFASLAVARSTAEGIVSSSNALKGWQQSLESSTGSSQAAAANLAFVRSETERLGLVLTGTASSYASFTAATRGTNLEGAQTREIFTAVAEAARVLNLSADKTTGALTALEQMVSKGNVQAEELRGQLGERLPGAFRIAAEAMNVTTAELGDLLERGEVTAEELLPKLAKRLRELYSDAATNASNAPAAEMARLQNAVFELEAAIGDAGFMQSLANGSRALAEALTALTQSGALDEIVGGLGTLAAIAGTAFAGRAIQSLQEWTAGKVRAAAATSALMEMERLAAAESVRGAQARALDLQQTLAVVAAAREQVVAKQALARADLESAQRTLAATEQMAVMSATLRARREATDQVVLAQQRLNAVTNELAGLGRQQVALQGQLTAAADLQVGAQTRLAAATGASSLAMRGLQAVGTGLFTLLGGWPGIALAAGYAIYSLNDAIRDSQAAAQASAISLGEYSDRLAEQVRLRELMRRTGANESEVRGISDYEATAASVARLRSELERLYELQATRTRSANDAGDLGILARIQNISEKLALATREIEDYEQQIGSAAFYAIKHGEEIPAAFQPVIDTIEGVVDAFKSLAGISTSTQAAAAATKAFSKDTTDAINALREKRETLDLSAAELVLYQAKQEAAKEATQEGRDAIMAEAQALADSITAKDAAKAASDAITETRRKEAEQLRDLTRAMREAEEERDRELAMAEEAAGSASAMIDALRDEAKQAGLTEVERRRLAETRAFDAAMQAAQAARTPEQLAALRAEFEAAMKVRDASELVAEQQELTSEAAKRAAEDSARAWTDFAQGLGRAVLDGAGGVKRYFKQLLDDLKAQIISSGLMNLFRSIFNIGGSSSGSPLSMLGAMFGGGGAGGGGISFGSIMSAFGGQSGGTGGGILSNLFSAQSWARAGQQLAGGFTSMFGGAGNVSALQSYGVLNTPTGMAGGFAGHGGLAGWGGAAAGALYGLGRGDGGVGTVGSTLAGGVAGYYAGGVMAGAAAGGMAGAGAAMAAIPVAGWIAAAALAIDALTGGKLFGTRYRPESSTSTLSIGDDGGDASMSIREVRQRSLFRGRRWRTRDVEAGDDAEEAADQLYDSIYSVMAESARALAIDTPPMIDAAIRTVTEYDKKGKAKGTKIFVDILGRTWEEATAELAASRLSSEAIIATIDAALGTTVEAALAGIDEGIDRASPEFRERIGEMIGELIPKDGPDSTGTVGEASAIAERWRSDAELLAEGAQLLLMAATDIRRGTGLLGEGGTLTQIADLIEDLQAPGESLAQTYARVAASTALLDQALALSRVSLEGTREQFVRLATDVVDAMGGLDRAAALVSNYANRFYTDAERARAAVTAARANATTQFADIDLDYTQFMGEGGMRAFREMFERLLPTLSADAIAQWYEAAEALGIVIDATDAYVASMTAQARAQASIIGEINAGIADLTMTDYERQVAGIEGQTRAYTEALIEAGMTMEQATTHALRYRDAQMGALEAQRQAARTSITDEMADSVADVGRSDWERQMVALDRRAQDYITALVETGVALDAATAAATAWRDSMRAALEEQRRGNFIDQLDDIEWEQSLAGMSAYDRQVATINRRYDELYATAVELGLGEGELLRIRRLQRGELDALASSTENASRALAQLGLAMVDAGGAVLGTEDARRSWTDIIAEATGVARGDSMSAEQRAIDQLNERFQRFASGITEGYQQGRLGAIIAGNVEQFDRDYLDRISQLEALRIEALANLRNDLDQQRFEREEAWVKRLLGLRDSLLLDEQLSTLTPAERVSEAQRQYDAAVSAIQAAAQTTATDDDEAARGAFESVARTLLREGRTSFGSDYRYDALLAQVLGDIDRFIADSPITVGQRVAEQAMQVVIPEGSLKLDTQPVEVLLNGLRNDQDEQTRALIEELREVRRELADIKTSNRLIADNTRGELMPVRAV